MNKKIFETELKLKPLFLKRNLNKKILYNGKINTPFLPTCCLFTITDISSETIRYNNIKIVGYKINNKCTTTSFESTISKLQDINFSIINYNCYEFTILYFFLFKRKSCKIFTKQINICNLINKKSFTVEGGKETFTVKYTIYDKREIHYSFKNILEPVIKNCKLKYLKPTEIYNPLEDFTFCSKRYLKGKVVKKNSPELKNDFLGYHLCKDILSSYQNLMIKWNNDIFINKKSLYRFILRFTIKNVAIKNRFEFIYLFFTKRLIDRQEYIQLVKKCINE